MPGSLPLIRSLLIATTLVISAPLLSAAQSSQTPPVLIPVAGQLLQPDGQPRTGAVVLILSLYREQDDQVASWLESQQVTLDQAGRYRVQIGATLPEGLPTELFTAAQPMRWLGVGAENEPEHLRVPIVSVTYAAKAASADTLDGRSVSDFVLSSTLKDDVRVAVNEIRASEASSSSPENVAPATSANVIQKGDGSGGITDSIMHEVNGRIGIGMNQPSEMLTVDGNVRFTAPLDSRGFFAYDGVVGGTNMFAFTRRSNHLQISAYDGIGFTTNATGGPYSGYQMFVTNAGNVGIGTTGPSEKLSVAGNVRFAGGLYQFDDPAAGTNMFSFTRSSNHLNVSSYDGIGFTTNATGGPYSGFQMFINNAGNVGIGTTGPSEKLTVAGSVRFTTPSDAGGLYAYDGPAGGTNMFSFTRRGNHLQVSAYDGIGFATNATGGPYPGFNLFITSAGNVGVGTEAPSSKLHVVGNTLITGNIQVDGNIAAKYQDVAEWVDAVEPLDAGTVIVIDSTAINRVTAAQRAYDSRVAGAVSPAPGLILGERGPNSVLVAQSGRVRIKVDARYGAIRAGDLLVTSATPGHAMRANPKKALPGTILGKALESLASGRGEILALLTLQ
jgi:hypothetical protein